MTAMMLFHCSDPVVSHATFVLMTQKFGLNLENFTEVGRMLVRWGSTVTSVTPDCRSFRGNAPLIRGPRDASRSSVHMIGRLLMSSLGSPTTFPFTTSTDPWFSMAFGVHRLAFTKVWRLFSSDMFRYSPSVMKSMLAFPAAKSIPDPLRFRQSMTTPSFVFIR